MSIVEYLSTLGVKLTNPYVLYQLERLEQSKIKLDSLRKARLREHDTQRKHLIDLTINLYSRYQKHTAN